ncbi:MAG: ABC transporter substrate-binding protein [Actinomycetota bacterium]|nr:ABC transporter substrate-binding protein [Actinomycetota bacterium]
MTRRRSAILALLILASACTGSKPQARPTAPVSGGTLHVAVRDLSSLDPSKASGRGATFVLAQVFRSLTSIDKDGVPVPAGASKWMVAANGLQWDFTIAPATFHNGKPVGAADFKFAFDRIALKITRSDVAYQLEAVKGFHEVKIAGTAKTLSGVIVIGPRRLRIVLTHPFAELARFLAHPALAPVPAAAFKKNPATYAAQPIGNGPFKVASARMPASVTLERYDGFGGTKAYLDKVQIDVRTDSEGVWRDLNGGKLDVGEIPVSRLSGAKRLGTQGFTPFWATTYYGLNLRLAKYAKPDVRRALALGIDRTKLATTIYGGTKDPATGILPTGIPGARTAPCDSCTFDQSKARALLNGVFKGHAPNFTIDHLDASPSREVAQEVARQWEDIGLRVALRAHSSSDYLKLLQSGKQDVAELGWLSDVPSPDAFLAQQLRRGSPNNQTSFADAEFDRDIDTARRTADDSARVGAYGRAQERALSLMPLIPLVFFRSHLAVRQNVYGFALNGAGIFDASAVWLIP